MFYSPGERVIPVTAVRCLQKKYLLLWVHISQTHTLTTWHYTHGNALCPNASEGRKGRIDRWMNRMKDGIKGGLKDHQNGWKKRKRKGCWTPSTILVTWSCLKHSLRKNKVSCFYINFQIFMKCELTFVIIVTNTWSWVLSANQDFEVQIFFFWK